MTVRAAVLAGGRGRRFGGRPKGLDRVGGRRILDRVVETVTAATGHDQFLVANHPDASGWRQGLEVVRDPIPGCGSLGGIYAAVTAGDGPVLVVAWDMPFLTRRLLEALIARHGAYDAFLPRSGGPRDVEPLCGVYQTTCAVPIRRRIDAGDLRATGFHDAVRIGTLDREEVERLGDPTVLFFNVNDDDDLREAERLWNSNAVTE